MKLIIHGYTGRMGQIVVSMAEQGFKGALTAAKVSPDCQEEKNGCYAALEHYDGEADCIIDFSNHAATKELLEYAVKREIPVVLATTGQTAEEVEMINKAAEKIAIFRSANMSIGIAFLANLAKQTAAAFPDADIEIVETHHNQKLDVPSGTALLLARKIKEARNDAEFIVGRHENGKRADKEIGIHSIRLGSETGTHEIIVSTGSETVTLKHKAENRSLFAEGALAAAEFICGKSAGLYDMRDIAG